MVKNKNNFEKSYTQHILNLYDKEEVSTISTGNLQLDQALVCGGIPRGRITEIFGNESSGKSTICFEIIKSCQKENGKVLFIDTEGSIDTKYIKKIGINIDKLTVAQPNNGELVFQMIEDSLIENCFDLIIIDSVAAMISITEQDIKFEEANMIGSHARMMSRGLRKIQSLMYKSNTAIVFVNQLREKVGVFFGNPEITTGGKSLRFFSTIRLEVKKVDLIKQGNDKIGIKSKVVVVKNKLGKPYNSAFINLYFNEGYDYTKDIIEFALSKEIISRKGAWFFLDDYRIGQGINSVYEYFKNNSDELNKIEAKLQDKTINQPKTNDALVVEESTDNE